eukprot:8112867-Alexandrium_andersonii.AAC.1
MVCALGPMVPERLLWKWQNGVNSEEGKKLMPDVSRLAPWTVDSGATFHAVTPLDVGPSVGVYAPINRRAIDPPARIATATGEAFVKEEATAKVPTLGSLVWAKARAESHRVLSLGALYRGNLFGFIWAPGSEAPVLLMPKEPKASKRHAVHVQVEHDVPVIPVEFREADHVDAEADVVKFLLMFFGSINRALPALVALDGGEKPGPGVKSSRTQAGRSASAGPRGAASLAEGLPPERSQIAGSYGVEPEREQLERDGNRHGA